ncbi:MAG: bile acid:sodium symporter family protein [Deltaproteobacteria bacterium]|nr:bile acid:sodium symporter family protein [Deltaproteobacteria bacterium]
MTIEKLGERLTRWFPAWVLIGGALALWRPKLFTWFDGDMITWGLAVIMLGMGITLSIDDFRAVARMPKAVGAGVLAQYLIMPLIGWATAKLTNLPLPFAVGVILVSCCPGGTASNVVTYIARGHVALSVLMTMCSTFAAIVMTPIMTKWLAGTLVPVPAWGLFLSTIKVVLAPLVLGLLLHHAAPRFSRAIVPIAPFISVLAIVLICASIIGSSAAVLLSSGARLVFALFLLHSGGFALGYILAALFGFDMQICRTVSIEVGMQNSGLGAVLARRHFADPLTAVPCAISATMHSVIGSFVAALWRRSSNAERRADEPEIVSD